MYINNFFLEKTILFLIISKYNTKELIKENLFLKKIFKKIFFKKKIIIKFGIDPTKKIIHLGHIKVINKINHYRNLNCRVIIIIGNFTSLIGDPTGSKYCRICNKKRNISLNINYFLYQLKFILKVINLYIYYNSEWLKILNIFDLINLFYLITLTKILYRNNLKIKFIKNIPFFISELIYPLLQSYDSVFIKSDIEIGGIDQKLNFLITRIIQKKINNKQQIILLLSLLIGSDGKTKMSKSKKNYITFKKNIFYFLKNIFLSKNFFYYYKNISYIKKKYILNKNYLKKKFLYDIINIYLNNKYFLNFLYKLIFIKIFIIKINLKFIYKIIKSIEFNSNNRIINFIKNNSLKINNILIRNFNFILFKGIYLFKFKKKYFIICIL